MAKKIDWKGDINATVTPFRKDGSIDQEAYCDNMKRLLDEGIDGFIVCGATGEPWSLSDEETMLCFEMAKKTCPDTVTLIGGCSDILPQRVMEKAAFAQKAGLHGVMVMPPYYVMPSLNEVRAFYEYVAANVKLPVLAYNNPEHQGFNMPPAFIAALANIDGIVAVKQSSPNFMDVVELVRLAGDRLRIFAGLSIGRGFPALTIGVDGFISSSEPQVMGREGVMLYDAYISGDFEKAREVQMKCLAVRKALNSVGSFPSNLKGAMNLLGRNGGHMRPPFQDLNKEELEILRTELRAAGMPV